MRFTLDTRARNWPGIWTRGTVVVIVFVFVTHWAPGEVLPLGIGCLLAAWLAAAPQNVLHRAALQGAG